MVFSPVWNSCPRLLFLFWKTILFINPHMKFHSPPFMPSEIRSWTTLHFMAIIQIPSLMIIKLSCTFDRFRHQHCISLLYLTSSCNYYNFLVKFYSGLQICPVHIDLFFFRSIVESLCWLYFIWFILLNLFKLLMYTDEHF